MLLTIIIFFLALSALFSGTEIAFISANKLIMELKKKKGTRRGKIIAAFFENPSEFLGTMLVGNNIALVSFTALASAPIALLLNTQLGWAEESVLTLLVSTIIITIIVLIFGEFLPKTLFRLYADEALYFFAYPLRFLKWLLAIPAFITTKLSNMLLQWVFKAPAEETEAAFTRLDLENYIKSTPTDAEDEIDTELFQKALNLHDVRVKAAMVPRTEIISVEVSQSVKDLIAVFQESKHSRILVMKDDIDNVLGYVHHQQLLHEPTAIRDIIMELPIIPETMRVRDLMNDFIRNKQGIAWVVDEFGGTAGIITFEDILEEIFGEIEDEHDVEAFVNQQLNEGEYLFSGRLEIDQLNEQYPNLDLPAGDYHTLSGYLVMTLGSIPEQGDEIELGNYRFKIVLMSDKKIETVRLIKKDEEDLEA